jgi:hypothetical protein
MDFTAVPFDRPRVDFFCAFLFATFATPLSDSEHLPVAQLRQRVAMVLHSGPDRQCPVQLLVQQQARQMMRQGHAAQGNPLVGARENRSR